MVECEVIDSSAPWLLRYTWVGDEGDDVTVVTYRLEPLGNGTRLTLEHTGFTGIGGLVVSKLLGCSARSISRSQRTRLDSPHRVTSARRREGWAGAPRMLMG